MNISQIEVQTYTVPTDRLESDGTFQWDSTTMVLVHLKAENHTGMGYTYADASAGNVIRSLLAKRILGRSAWNIPGCWATMREALRNQGESGIGAMAASAVDNALWDLKARLLDIPLVTLLGAARPRVPVYGSGGFTSYTHEELRTQLGGWVAQGIPRVKMKIGRDPDADYERVQTARKAIGDRAALFVDANGAYSRKQAVNMAELMDTLDVTWFEEPVYHMDWEGLRLLRDRAPGGMDIAVGEYGYEITYFRHLLEAGAADVMQADVTRCGITGFLEVAAICDSNHIPLSSHCAPAMHLHPCCAVNGFRHMEYFHDHARIERLFFEGVRNPVNGELSPDLSRPGTGLELRREDVKRYLVDTWTEYGSKGTEKDFVTEAQRDTEKENV